MRTGSPYLSIIAISPQTACQPTTLYNKTIPKITFLKIENVRIMLPGHYPFLSAERGETKTQERRVAMSKDIDCEGDPKGTFPNGIAHATVREVRAHLEKGIPIDSRDADGNTILLRAVQNGATYAVVKALLDCGAAVAAVNNRGENSLMAAATRGRGKVAALLLEQRADPNTRDQSGMTALMRACKNGHLTVAKALLVIDRALFGSHRLT